jgi:hypothetical protein
MLRKTAEQMPALVNYILQFFCPKLIEIKRRPCRGSARCGGCCRPRWRESRRRIRRLGGAKCYNFTHI